MVQQQAKSVTISQQHPKKNIILLLVSSIQLTASNTSHLEGENGIDRLVPVNNGVNDDLDGVVPGEEAGDLHGVPYDAD